VGREVFRCNAVRDGETLRLELKGDIDEQTDLGALLKHQASSVVIDLSKICRINSAGCHRWVRFLEAMSNGRTLRLSRCSTTFVAQAMMIPNMIARTSVESLYLPYWCERCGEELELLSRTGEDFQQKPKCPRCGDPLTPDSYASSIGVLLNPRSS